MKETSLTLTKNHTTPSSSGSFKPKNAYKGGNINMKNINDMAKYFNLGCQECTTLWNSNDKLNPRSTLTIISLDSCKHLLGEKDEQDNWIAFKTGAIKQLENIGSDKSKIVGRYIFIEESDNCISLIEIEHSTFIKYFQIEYPDLLGETLDSKEDLQLFFKTICSNISISSFIPVKYFTRYLQIFY